MASCYQSRVLNAPIQKVWNIIKDFQNLNWAPNVITSCETVGEIKGNIIGAQRILNGAFEETLQSIDEKKFSFTYSIDEAVSPVSSKEVDNYLGKVSLISITQTDETFIQWESTWESKTKEAEEFCHTIYVAIMADLNKSLIESKLS